MATLNDVPFKIIRQVFTTVQNNSIKDILGSDTVSVEHMGYSTEPLRLVCFVQNEDEYDNFKEEYHSSGTQTLIIHENSGRQYTVYGLGSTTEIDGEMENYKQGIVFMATFKQATPYKESVEEATRTKSITTQNQEWTADDDGNDVKTLGNVDAVPDIQVTGGTKETVITQSSNDSNYNLSNSGSSVTITQSLDNAIGMQLNATHAVGQTINCRKAGMAIIDSFQVSVLNFVSGGNVTCTVYDSIGGTALGSKVVNITGNGLHTFTFATPIAVVQSENTCTDPTDANKIYFKLTTAAEMSLHHEGTNPYPDGGAYNNDSNSGISTIDLKFLVSGHSCKEIKQTFEVDNKCQLSKVLLNLCKYQYAGTNPVTVTIKESATILGTGTSVLSGTTFTDVTFKLEPNNGGDLELSPGTTYTISITPPSDSGNTTNVLIKTNTTSVYADGAVTLVEDGDTTRAQTHDLYFTLSAYRGNKDVQIYNTADTTVKCDISNYMLPTIIHRIDVDGYGTIDFDDDFTTDKWIYTAYDWANITHDEANDELDIADDGYIYWPEDTKYPITGTPTLTARINITAGIPTIQISTDASTWYDIDTAIVDDVETVYPLDSDGNLSLAGKTIFYWRIDCVKAAAATCSIKYFKLDIAIHTIYAKNPKITKGASASTFRCDQDPDSGLACVVALIFRHRWWT